MSKHRVFWVLVIVLTAVFLFVLYHAAIPEYKAGKGGAYVTGLERAGIPFGAKSDIEEKIWEASKIAGIKYVVGMFLGLVCYFVALLLIVGYMFGLPQLRVKKTLLAGVVITGIAALAASGAQLFIGKSIENALKASVGLWLIGGGVFLVLVIIVWITKQGVRLFLLGRGKRIKTGES